MIAAMGVLFVGRASGHSWLTPCAGVLQMVLPVVCIMMWTLLQGMLEARWGQAKDHAYYMCLAILASQSPALMRLFVIPGIAATRLAHHRLSGGDDRKALTPGEWLLCKETAYMLQSIALVLPFCWPTSPFARQASQWWRHTVLGERGVGHSWGGAPLKRDRLTGMASVLVTALLLATKAAVIVRYVWYVSTIGQRGGDLCELYVSESAASTMVHA